MIADITIELVGFLVFIFLQALFINGVHFCFQGKCIQDINKGRICSGNVFYKINPSFFEKAKNKWWSSPLFSCIRCMASFHSVYTYWPFVIYIFGFHFIEIPVWVADMFILTSINYYIYQKI